MPIQNWSESIVVVDLANDPAFTDDLNALVEMLTARPTVDVVLNMSGVAYVNSSNISKLLRIRKTMITNGRRLRLAGVSSQVGRIFHEAGLDKVFEFADNMMMALMLLQNSRG